MNLVKLKRFKKGDWKPGEKNQIFCNGNKEPVRILCDDAKEPMCVVGLVSTHENTEIINVWNDWGQRINGVVGYEDDLFVAEEFIPPQYVYVLFDREKITVHKTHGEARRSAQYPNPLITRYRLKDDENETC